MENTDIVKQDRLNKLSELTGYSENQISLIKNTVAKNTTDAELAMFGSMAKNYKLDPFNIEIWCYKDHKNNLILFAGRDGFLRIGQNDKRWNGIYSCEVREGEIYEQNFNGETVTIKHTKTPKKGKILGAYCFIKPKGCETPTIEYVDFETYNKNQFVWKSHPADMIKKVAEVKALKKAFGISGLQDENDFYQTNEKVYPIDTEEQVSMKTYAYIESLISTSTLDDEEKNVLDVELQNGISSVRSEDLIHYLKLR